MIKSWQNDWWTREQILGDTNDRWPALDTAPIKQVSAFKWEYLLIVKSVLECQHVIRLN